ncbi:MAG: hypothetical protein WB809_07990 [Thermoplasmata archaeon]
MGSQLPSSTLTEAPPDTFASDLSSQDYNRRDFDYYEDAEHRGAAVVVYGGLILAFCGMSWAVGVSVSRENITGFVTTFFGVFAFAFLAPVLFYFRGGEATLAGMLAATTLFLVGLAGLANPGASWLAAVILLTFIGAGSVAIGALLTYDAWEQSTQFQTQPSA